MSTTVVQSWLARAARFASRVDLFNFGRWMVLATLVGCGGRTRGIAF